MSNSCGILLLKHFLEALSEILARDLVKNLSVFHSFTSQCLPEIVEIMRRASILCSGCGMSMSANNIPHLEPVKRREEIPDLFF